MTIPAFGLGTFRLQQDAAQHAVRTALDVGYRAIDTAQIYGNEADVGQAVAESGVARDALFLTTKIWTENLSAAKLIPSLQQSLRALRSDYVDLTLIHWPSPGGAVPLAESLDALLEARERGLTRQIGVSNFPIALWAQSIQHAGRDQIATNQVELSPYLQNRALQAYAREQNIPLTSYMTLAYGAVLQDPVLQRIAADRSATPAQVALAWALQRGVAVIPSSTQRSHLESNLLAQTLTLTPEEMTAIDALERNGRLVNPEGLAPQWD